MEFKKHGQMSELKEGRRGEKRQEGKRIDGAGSRKKGNPWCLGENEPTLPEKKQKIKKTKKPHGGKENGKDAEFLQG